MEVSTKTVSQGRNEPVRRTSYETPQTLVDNPKGVIRNLEELRVVAEERVKEHVVYLELVRWGELGFDPVTTTRVKFVEDSV